MKKKELELKLGIIEQKLMFLDTMIRTNIMKDLYKVWQIKKN